MHPYFSQFITVAAVHLLAVASPGPDFAVVVRQSITHGRNTALWTSLGIGTGILIHVSYSLLGLGLFISRSLVVFSVMKTLCALYLIYLGVSAVRTPPMRKKDIEATDRSSGRPGAGRAFRTGFLTNGLNPKATLFFLSLFTVIIDPATPLVIQAGYGIYMALATALWFSCLSFFFGHDSVRRLFYRIGHWFDRLTGVVLIGLGLQFALSRNG
ncbi:MAG TPA: LysE family translocator [Desulfobulbus sp.]|nr:LysE family translocator [Desulfobulbus sp.]